MTLILGSGRGEASRKLLDRIATPATAWSRRGQRRTSGNGQALEYGLRMTDRAAASPSCPTSRSSVAMTTVDD